MLDLVGAIVGMVAIGINLAGFAHAVTPDLPRRLILAGISGAWVGLASGLGAAGALAFSPDQPVPLIGVLFALPLLVTGLLALALPRMRSALMSVPMPLLIGLNAMRVLGVLFLALAAAGRLSGPFPYCAGVGDLITGALAIPLALRVARSADVPSSLVRRWNLFGALDLVVAVSLGLASAQGSPIQLIHSGPGSEAMQSLPYCLVPAVLVPFYLITHAIVAAQLAAARAVPIAVRT